MQKIEYDPEARILKIRFYRTKSIDSEIRGNVVLDYDKDGRLVQVDIMDVDLEKLIGMNVKKQKRSTDNTYAALK